MKNTTFKLLRNIFIALAAVGFTLSASDSWSASREKTVYAFSGGADGSHPNGSLISDSAGNLYGTSAEGGTNNYGTVFKLSRSANRGWIENAIHSFNNTDGAHPEGGLIFDSLGNLYGTTSMGGSFGIGTVFELSPGPHGSWTEKVLHSLQGTDGAYPYGGLAFDAQGNLYGTTYQGGQYSQQCYYGCGSVFEVSPIGNGQWTGKGIHIFNGNDGSAPFSTPVFDAAGNLYGTTTGFNSKNPGNVFQLTPNGSGNWTESVLYNFTGQNGDQPYAGLVFDSAGSLYGTTYQGGTAGFAGTVFKLTPDGNGKWTETLLHSFNNSDGSFVYAGVVFDSAGNLWGATSGYGPDVGSIYKLAPNGDGTWSITVLHTFNDIQVNGGVAFDAAGNAYSTSYEGGDLSGCGGTGCGMVFQVAP
jgi:uncharacterized repeat protein (TIGR03803 family)